MQYSLIKSLFTGIIVNYRLTYYISLLDRLNDSELLDLEDSAFFRCANG